MNNQCSVTADLNAYQRRLEKAEREYPERLERELEYWETRNDIFSIVVEGIGERASEAAMMKAYFDNDSAVFGRLALAAAKEYIKGLAEAEL